MNSGKASFNGFDLWSPVYDLVAWLVFQGRLQSATLDWLESIDDAETLLILGGGTGWYLPQLFAHKPNIEVVYVDSSAAMIESAKRYAKEISPISKITFCHCSVFELQAQEIDMVVSFFFLDMFNESTIASLLTTLRSRNKEPMWLLLDFWLPANSHRDLRSLLVGFMYFCFRISCGIEAQRLPTIERIFPEHGFSCTKVKNYAGGLIKGWLFSPKSHQFIPCHQELSDLDTSE